MLGPGDRVGQALAESADVDFISLTGGIDASGIPAMIAYFLANLLWQITAFVANALIALFGLAFSLDLLNRSPSTGGAGALAPVSDVRMLWDLRRAERTSSSMMSASTMR